MSDEASVRKEITEAMLMAGVMAYVDWKVRRKVDSALSDGDLAANVFVAMRRRQELDGQKGKVRV